MLLLGEVAGNDIVVFMLRGGMRDDGGGGDRAGSCCSNVDCGGCGSCVSKRDSVATDEAVGFPYPPALLRISFFLVPIPIDVEGINRSF